MNCRPWSRPACIALSTLIGTVIFGLISPAIFTFNSPLPSTQTSKGFGFWPSSWINYDAADLAALREKQSQQLLDLMANSDWWDKSQSQSSAAHNQDSITRIAACLDSPSSTTLCPPRPLILSTYNYIEQYIAGGAPGGEVIWMQSVVPTMQALGFRFLILREYEDMIRISRIASSLIHTYWGEAHFTTSCVNDPRCIAQHTPPYLEREDETLPTVPEGMAASGEDHLWVNLDGESKWERVPIEERGTIPVERLFSLEWWPNAPLKEHQDDDYHGPGREVPGPNPFGNLWSLTPYDYPQHTFLPWSMEKSNCDKVKTVPYAARENQSVLVLSKHSTMFHWYTDPEFWNSESVRQSGLKVYATARNRTEQPLPAGITNFGPQSQDDYAEIVAKMRAMIGIGRPTLSPSPWLALCKGVPVVLWKAHDREPANRWERYLYELSQHARVAAVGPPYVYEYHGANNTQMLDALKKAVSTPIDPYVPPTMRESFVTETISRWTEIDLDLALKKWLQEHDGRTPRPYIGHRRAWLKEGKADHFKKLEPGDWRIARAMSGVE